MGCAGQHGRQLPSSSQDVHFHLPLLKEVEMGHLPRGVDLVLVCFF